MDSQNSDHRNQGRADTVGVYRSQAPWSEPSGHDMACVSLRRGGSAEQRPQEPAPNRHGGRVQVSGSVEWAEQTRRACISLRQGGFAEQRPQEPGPSRHDGRGQVSGRMASRSSTATKVSRSRHERRGGASGRMAAQTRGDTTTLQTRRVWIERGRKRSY